jgi:hypothetical protein
MKIPNQLRKKMHVALDNALDAEELKKIVVGDAPKEKAKLSSDIISKTEATIRSCLAKAERAKKSKDEDDHEMAEMYRADAKDMQKVLDLAKAGKWSAAASKFWDMDTSPREQIQRLGVFAAKASGEYYDD